MQLFSWSVIRMAWQVWRNQPLKPSTHIPHFLLFFFLLLFFWLHVKKLRLQNCCHNHFISFYPPISQYQRRSMKMQIRTSATLSQPSTTKQNRERETEDRDDEEENSKKKTSDHSVGTRALAGTLQQGVKLFAGMMDWGNKWTEALSVS